MVRPRRRSSKARTTSRCWRRVDRIRRCRLERRSIDRLARSRLLVDPALIRAGVPHDAGPPHGRHADRPRERDRRDDDRGDRQWSPSRRRPACARNRPRRGVRADLDRDPRVDRPPAPMALPRPGRTSPPPRTSGSPRSRPRRLDDAGGCHHCGRCVLGCPYGIKWDARRLPRRRSGARCERAHRGPASTGSRWRAAVRSAS